MIATVLCEWVEDSPTYRHPSIDGVVANWQDVTGQDSSIIVPAVNIVVVECTDEDAVITALETDPRFVVLDSEVLIA